MSPVSKKRPRRCGWCRAADHDRRRCPKPGARPAPAPPLVADPFGDYVRVTKSMEAAAQELRTLREPELAEQADQLRWAIARAYWRRWEGMRK